MLSNTCALDKWQSLTNLYAQADERDTTNASPKESDMMDESDESSRGRGATAGQECLASGSGTNSQTRKGLEGTISCLLDGCLIDNHDLAPKEEALKDRSSTNSLKSGDYRSTDPGQPRLLDSNAGMHAALRVVQSCMWPDM